MSTINKDTSDITIEDVRPLIENKTPVSSSSSIIRNVNNDISIRNGKYGHYIFYKTDKMNKPKFIKLKGFKGDYNNCHLDDLVKFVANN